MDNFGDNINTRDQTVTLGTKTRSFKRGLKLILLIGMIFIILFGLGLYLFKTKLSPSSNLIYHVPNDAFLIVETDQPFTAWNKIKNSMAWNAIASKNDYMSELTASVSTLGTSMTGLDQILSKVSDRQVYISGHLYNKSSYDFLYIVDIQGLGIVEQIMTKLSGVKKRSHKQTDIFEYKPSGTKKTLYFSFVANAFISSFTHTLVEASIEEYDEPFIGRAFEFIDINREITDHGLFRIYAQYAQIPEFLSSGSSNSQTNYLKLVKDLNFSGLHFDIEDDDLLKLQGYLNYNDSTISLVDVLNRSGKSKITLPSIAPKRTAFYLNFGFDSAGKFYENIQQLASSNAEYGKDFLTSSRKLERFLNINIKDDFISWIDKNISILHTISSSGGRENELSLVIKAKSAEQAKHKLDHLLRQVRKKTPVKFKKVDYEGFEINFISIKGFFKLIFGKLFSKLEKPYYTIIEDHVVFSNSPQTIRGIIDDYKAGLTLTNNSTYNDFMDENTTSTSLKVYLQTPAFSRHLNDLLDQETLDLIIPFKQQILQYPQICLTLHPFQKMIETNLVAQYGESEIMDTGEGNQGPLPIDTMDILLKKLVFEEELIIEEEIHLVDLTAKSQAENFATGKPKYEVSIKDGKKHGAYIEYNTNETVKIKGRYREGKKYGMWKYYDEHGQLVKKTRFRDGIEK